MQSYANIQHTHNNGNRTGAAYQLAGKKAQAVTDNRIQASAQLKQASGMQYGNEKTVQRSIFNKLIGNSLSDLGTFVTGHVLGIGGPSADNDPSYGSLTGRGFGTYMDVRLNYPALGTKTGSGDDNATWVALKKRRIKTNTYYVQAHLLSEKLGGSGTDWENLVPLTQRGNGLMETKIESHVKLAAGQGGQMRYKVQALYGQWPWQWPSYWVNMLSSTWLPLVLPGIYSTLAALRDAESHVPSAIYAQWWVVNGQGSWIPYVGRITQEPNNVSGFWIQHGNDVIDMGKANALWQIAEQSVASLLMPLILPKLVAANLVTETMAKALNPTQFMESLYGVIASPAQWFYDHQYNIDFITKWIGDGKLKALADIILSRFGGLVQLSLPVGEKHSAKREEVSMYQGLGNDAPVINAIPRRTTRSGVNF